MGCSPERGCSTSGSLPAEAASLLRSSLLASMRQEGANLAARVAERRLLSQWARGTPTRAGLPAAEALALFAGLGAEVRRGDRPPGSGARVGAPTPSLDPDAAEASFGTADCSCYDDPAEDDPCHDGEGKVAEAYTRWVPYGDDQCRARVKCVTGKCGPSCERNAVIWDLIGECQHKGYNWACGGPRPYSWVYAGKERCELHACCASIDGGAGVVPTGKYASACANGEAVDEGIYRPACPRRGDDGSTGGSGGSGFEQANAGGALLLAFEALVAKVEVDVALAGLAATVGSLRGDWDPNLGNEDTGVGGPCDTSPLPECADEMEEGYAEVSPNRLAKEIWGPAAALAGEKTAERCNAGPGYGKHYRVVVGGRFMGTILCCPCCEPLGGGWSSTDELTLCKATYLYD